MWIAFIILVGAILFMIIDTHNLKNQRIEKIKKLASITNENDPYALLELGINYLAIKEFAAAFSKFKSASDLGSNEATAYLGNMHINGQFVNKDIITGESLLKTSARSNCALGQRFLGALYATGYGSSKDCLFWLILSSVNNDHGAPFMLGNIYEKGQIVPASLSKAAAWYKFSLKHPENLSLQQSTENLIKNFNDIEKEIYFKTALHINRMINSNDFDELTISIKLYMDNEL